MDVPSYEVFRRAVVTIPPATLDEDEYVEVELQFEDPEAFVEPEQSGPFWQHMRLISNLPHVEASLFLPGHQQKGKSAMLMVDSGMLCSKYQMLALNP